jgi:hypothetical protein
VFLGVVDLLLVQGLGWMAAQTGLQKWQPQLGWIQPKRGCCPYLFFFFEQNLPPSLFSLLIGF